jgi:hypothetical protein
LDCSGECSIYRDARVLRVRSEVDMLAASPASYRARRGCGRVLLIKAKLEVVLARSGGGWFGRLASTTAAAFTGSCRRLRRRRSRVCAARVSGGVAVSRRCSTRWKGVQGVLEVVAWRVASMRLWRATRNASGMLARSGRASSGESTASTATRPWLGEVEG